jgi:hypothetical protein
VDDLLETVLLTAEVEELMANPARPARGTVIESHLDRRTGAVATVLVAVGTLRTGDIVQAGATFGKVGACACASSGNAMHCAGNHARGAAMVRFWCMAQCGRSLLHACFIAPCSAAVQPETCQMGLPTWAWATQQALLSSILLSASPL